MHGFDAARLTQPPLALYVHLPWCVRKCPYCDFNSHQAPKDLPEQAYVAALLADLELDLPLVWGRPVVSIFLGGGTPSLFSELAISHLLDGIRARLKVRPDAEITLETNPGTTEHGRFEGYRAAGVNRISLGVQSFDNGILKKLGRIHSAGETQHAFALARAAGFDNINIDLMYALPGQSQDGALEDLTLGLALQPEHISHYHLTMEPETVFARFPPAELPDEDQAWDMQEACQSVLAAAGYEHYEVSAYARAGKRSVHNQVYWRFGDYLGIGAGAHAKLTDLNTGVITRYAKQKIPRLYLESATSPLRVVETRPLTATQLPFEFMLNALRLNEGFPYQDFSARTGLVLEHAPGWQQALQLGLIEREHTQVRPTELGKRFLNDLVNCFS